MEQMTLFGNNRTMTPLASRLRPDSLDDFVGQQHLVGEGKILRHVIERDPDILHDLLGAAGGGQDDAGQHHRGQDKVGIY